MLRTVVASVVLVLLLGGCGGATGSDDEAARAETVAAAEQKLAQRRAAEARWREGFAGWSASALYAAEAVTGTFTNTHTLTLVLNGDPQARAELNTKLAQLKTCSRDVERLGKAPARFREVRAGAMRACAHLEAGASLVRLGLEALPEPLGEGLLERGANELGAGTQLVLEASGSLPASAP